MPQTGPSFNHQEHVNQFEHTPARVAINRSNRYFTTDAGVSNPGGHGSSNCQPIPGPMQWLLPKGMIDARPVFTPKTYQNWRMDLKLRKMAQAGASETQLVSKIVAAFLLNMRMEVTTYMENTESSADARSIDAVLQIMNIRFRITDSERAWSRLSSLAEFKRQSAENFKGFRTRFTRCTARLNAHAANLSESVIFPMGCAGCANPRMPIANFTGHPGNIPRPYIGEYVT